MTKPTLPASSAATSSLDTSLLRWRWARRSPQSFQLAVVTAFFAAGSLCSVAFVLVDPSDRGVLIGLPLSVVVALANLAFFWGRTLRRCPACREQTLTHDEDHDRFHCSACSWREGERPDPVKLAAMDKGRIPTTVVLLPLAVPMLLNTGLAVTHGVGRIEVGTVFTPLFGASFLLIGLWSLWVGMIWERTTDGFRSHWRPPSRATPFLIAAAFGGIGLYQLVTGLAALGG